MRIVKYFGEHINIQMSILTPFFYKQQFNVEFDKDLLKHLNSPETTVGNRLVWAMSKTADFDLVDFEQWIRLFDEGETSWGEIRNELLRYFANYRFNTDGENDSTPTVEHQHFETKLVGTALKMGFDFESLKYILPSDLTKMVDETTIRKATQSDIDALLA